MGTIFSINEGNTKHFDGATVELLASAKEKGHTGRYIGSMVADVHRTLLYGGIFCYPALNKQLGKKGKLRLLHEANPMAFIIEQAGGKASTGYQRIMDIMPSSISMTT